MLETARSLEEQLVTWQATLDSDIEKVLTEEQIAQYRGSQPTVAKLDVTASDLEAFGLEVPEADEETESSLNADCTDCYYTYYYGYYSYIYQYYAYLYAYYGYSSTGSFYAYNAYIYNYYANYYANYVYIYGNYAYTYCPNSTYAFYAFYYSDYTLWYSYYGYLYSYYAYYYSSDINLYYSYIYAVEGYTNSTYANIYASECTDEKVLQIGINEISKDQNKGFYWDYLLYLPSDVNNKNLLIIPNNTGFRHNDIEVHKTYAYDLIYWRKTFADSLKIPLLVPVFPRPDDETDGTISSQYLGRGTFETDIIELKRQDIQLLHMVDDALDRLASDGYEFSNKVIIWGYSASGIFTSRITVLHPNRIKAAAFGGHGWSIAPVSEFDGLDLPYPYGIYDYESLIGEPFDTLEFSNVAIYSFMGAIDDNGWGMHWYIGEGVDPHPFYDSFDQKFGTTALELMNSAEALYSTVTSNASFVLYDEIGHDITEKMDLDVMDFFRNNKE